MDPKLIRLKANLQRARNRRDEAARELRETKEELARAIKWSNASSLGLTIVKEAAIAIATAATGYGLARAIQNSVRLARWAKHGSRLAQVLRRGSWVIGGIAAEWLANGVRGDLRGALLGSVATLAKTERAGALLTLCLAASEAALEEATKLESKLRAQQPPPAPRLSWSARTIWRQQEDFEVVWKYYFEKNVEHLVWSRCSEIQDALVETFMTQEIYPDPLHPVRALQALDEVLQAQRTGTDDACLDRIARKASKLVAELRQDGIYVRRPRPGEGPLSRIAEIFGYLDSNTCNMLGYKFRRYKALRRHGTFDGLYHWWDQEGRAEISSLLEAAHISRNLPVNLIKEGDEQAMSGR